MMLAKNISFGALLILLILVACEGEKPKEPPLQTTIANFCPQDGKAIIEKGSEVPVRVALSGYLAVPRIMTLQSDTLNIRLYEGKDLQGTDIPLSIEIGSGKNQVTKLPEKYLDSDLLVKSNTSKMILANQKVNVIAGRYMGVLDEPVKKCWLRLESIELAE